MKNYLFVIAIIFASLGNAQKLYFPKDNYKDSVTLAETIPTLAKKVISNYQNPDKTTYFDNMFRFTMVAEQYDKVSPYLDSLRELISSGDALVTKGYGVQFEAYSKAALQIQKTKTEKLQTVFPQMFTEAYQNLSEKAKTGVSQYASTDVNALKESLKKLIDKQKNSDTISLENAAEFLRAYQSYSVYSQTLQLMKAVIVEQDRKKYMLNTVLIKTRDGSTIQAEVVRKRGIQEKMPAVFIFNIYTDSAYNVSRAKLYAAEGYVGVVANTRGKGKSPEAIEPFEHDAKDAYDIIDWISKQKWSNGKVGMTGGSYLGFAQWAAAKYLHPALKTIMPEVAVGIGIDYPMLGNVFMSYMLRWIHYVTNNKLTDNADFTNTSHWDSVFNDWYRKGSSFRSLDTLEGRPSAIFRRWLQHPSFDNYWQHMTSFDKDFSKINIPVLTTTGYFDDDQIGALYYYRQHYLHNPHANNYLVVGPYSHGGAQSYPSSELNGYKVDSVATQFNFIDLSVQWFNYVLKDSSKPGLLQNKVNYEVMGGNEWKHVPSLGAMSNDTLTLYLNNIRTNEFYKLSDKPDPHEYIKQEVDLADRTDSLVQETKIVDQTIDARNAVSFISQRFKRPFIVNGSFTASLQASINKRDMDVVMYMYERTPDGKYFQLGMSLQRASFAENRSKRNLLPANQKVNIPITYSTLTGKQIQTGSQLVIVVGINKNRNWQINYGTGKDISDETIKDAAISLNIKWFTDSFVKIPIWR